MWLADFRVVLPDTFVPRGSVRIEDGRVAEIVDGPVSGAMISGDGLLLLPGFVDMHGDMVEWEVELRPNVRMPMELGLRDLDRRLAASGVTTAYAAVSFHPGSAYGHIRHFDNTSAIIRALKSMGDVLKVDHRVHARFEYTFPDALRVIEGLIAEGAVQLVSLSDHTPGQGQYRDIKAHIVRVTREKDLNRDKA
jgi:alpha-D-ribose 1-methylphosphonate 5-triphosphate diphosphatase